ncbi:MAG: thiamine monophosphate synthase [Acidobacteriales bacterium]|nr:thiamine monophosphate synthase [Terriglobales bacterium]
MRHRASRAAWPRRFWYYTFRFSSQLHGSASILAVLLYYITASEQFPGDARARHAKLIDTIAAAARWGVDFIQLRERDLTPHKLEVLAREAVACVRKNSSSTKLLINSRVDIAIAARADGVHLRSGHEDLSPADARVIFHRSGIKNPVIAASCHNQEQIAEAESYGADFAVFAPVFEKVETHIVPLGVDALKKVCSREIAASARMPVLALGGVTVGNAASCIGAGAAGLAGIRLFQLGDLGKTITDLRRLDAQPLTLHKTAIANPRRRHPYQP